MKTLVIISPVYQEADVIADFYRAVKVQLDQLSGYSATMLFVVDRGKDATLTILKDIARRDTTVRILGLSTRFGHQMSLLAGIDYAVADAVIMMDSDLQHPPALIPQFLKRFEAGDEIVNAIREDVNNVGVFKRVSSRLFYWLMKLISEVPLGENAPDFRLISGRVAQLIREDIRERNFFLRGIIPWMGFTQTSIRFTAAPRPGGATKYSLGRLLNLGLAGVVSFSRKPLRLPFFLGVFTASLAAIWTIVLIVTAAISQAWPSGLAGVVWLILVLASVQLVVLGIMGEYLGAMFEEVKKRPHYIIEEKVNF